jgi:hypothetical protein
MKSYFLFLLIVLSFNSFSQESVKLKQIGLEVMTKDVGKMNWGDAKEACKGFGDGWRLPTIDELKKIYKYKDFIGGFKEAYYWSSTEVDIKPSLYAWDFSFGNGIDGNYGKGLTLCVRAVRDLK